MLLALWYVGAPDHVVPASNGFRLLRLRLRITVQSAIDLYP